MNEPKRKPRFFIIYYAGIEYGSPSLSYIGSCGWIDFEYPRRSEITPKIANDYEDMGKPIRGVSITNIDEVSKEDYERFFL